MVDGETENGVYYPKNLLSWEFWPNFLRLSDQVHYLAKVYYLWVYYLGGSTVSEGSIQRTRDMSDADFSGHVWESEEPMKLTLHQKDELFRVIAKKRRLDEVGFEVLEICDEMARHFDKHIRIKARRTECMGANGSPSK